MRPGDSRWCRNLPLAEPYHGQSPCYLKPIRDIGEVSTGMVRVSPIRRRPTIRHLGRASLPSPPTRLQLSILFSGGSGGGGFNPPQNWKFLRTCLFEDAESPFSRIPGPAPLFTRGVDSSHATWTRVGLESLFLWPVTWLGLAKKWLATWLGLARKWLVTNASQKLLERPRDLINFFKVWSFSLLFLFFLLFLLSLPLFSFTFYYIPLLMTGVEEIMCDLTCTWTKRLVTWLVFGPNDLWLGLDLHGNDLWLDLDLQGNDLWLDLDLQGNDLWLDLDLQKMTCCHLCYLPVELETFIDASPHMKQRIFYRHATK